MQNCTFVLCYLYRLTHQQGCPYTHKHQSWAGQLVVMELRETNDIFLVYQARPERNPSAAIAIGCALAIPAFLLFAIGLGLIIEFAELVPQEEGSDNLILGLIVLVSFVGLVIFTQRFWFGWLSPRLSWSTWTFDKSSGTVTQQPWLGLNTQSYLLNSIQDVDVTQKRLGYVDDAETGSTEVLWLWQLHLQLINRRIILMSQRRGLDTSEWAYTNLVEAQNTIREFLSSN